MTKDQFAESIKAKYPQYQSLSNTELADKMLTKYPQYASQIEEDIDPAGVMPKTVSQALPSSGQAQSFQGNIFSNPVGMAKDLYSRGKNVVQQTGAMAKEGLKQIGEKATDVKEAFTSPETYIAEQDRSVPTPEGEDRSIVNRLQQAGMGITGMLGGAGKTVASPVIGALGAAQPEIQGAIEGYKKAWGLVPEETRKSVEQKAQEILQSVPEDVKQQASDAFWALGLTAAPMEANAAVKAGKAVGQEAAKVASNLYNYETAAVKAIKKPVQKIIQETISAETGVPVNDLKTAVTSKSKDLFNKAIDGQISRESLQTEVADAMKSATKELSTTSKQYAGIREGTATYKLPKTDINEVLANNGLKISKGKIVEQGELSSKLTKSEIDFINKEITSNLPKGTITGKQYLNLEDLLDKAAGWESLASSDAKSFVRQLRHTVSESAKAQIPELAKIKGELAPQIQTLGQFRQDFFKWNKYTRDWELKPGSAAKIARLTKSSQGADILPRLEKVVPGITEKIKALSAVESVESAMSKAGLYKKGAIGMMGGGAIGAVAGGGLPGALVGSIIGLVMSNPRIAITILQKFGGDSIFGDTAKLVNKINKGGNLTKVESEGLANIVKKMSTKEPSMETIIEQGTGWKPGMRAVFDTALRNKDAATITKMLPEVPKEYAQRFSKEIGAILGSSTF